MGVIGLNVGSVPGKDVNTPQGGNAEMLTNFVSCANGCPNGRLGLGRIAYPGRWEYCVQHEIGRRTKNRGVYRVLAQPVQKRNVRTGRVADETSGNIVLQEVVS